MLPRYPVKTARGARRLPGTAGAFPSKTFRHVETARPVFIASGGGVCSPRGLRVSSTACA